MNAIEIRNSFIEFFKNRHHKEIPGSSLIPENDPSVLFTTAGMHPLVPYLLGEPHPQGKWLVNYQKCLRTDDIEEVGDDIHLTFFEMLGNWSLGDYFKEEAIKMSYDFLVNTLRLNPDRLVVTVFEGDDDAPKDEEAARVWRSVGVKEKNVYYFGKKHNWWGPAGQTGPCGPDTEIFYDSLKPKCSAGCNPACSCGKYWEIWNNVFMQYYKNADGTYSALQQKNVDTGLGLERMTAILEGRESIFETELFSDIVMQVKTLSRFGSLGKEILESYDKTTSGDILAYGGRTAGGGKPSDNYIPEGNGRLADSDKAADSKYKESVRIIVDHIRASCFLLRDGVAPGNSDQGYVLRRLIRRAIRHMCKICIDPEHIADLGSTVIKSLRELYNELDGYEDDIVKSLAEEKNKFIKTLGTGEKQFFKALEKCTNEGVSVLDAKTVFTLYDTFGFPPEMTAELASEYNMAVDYDGFKELYFKHQELSRKGALQKFKGGLADNTEETVALHTATHLLHKALKTVLGDHVHQKGSNITKERLRFDFSHGQKMTPTELKKVEDIVNKAIEQGLQVQCDEMSFEKAVKTGADGLFTEKYSQMVKVYSIGDFSREICGGPHVCNTAELGYFRITKEESVSSGVRRIKAVLTNRQHDL